ncbi:MAG: glycine--tRNA ligase subunit beta, partial [Nitrospirae bacterium 13_1_40CM_2_62_10]
RVLAARLADAKFFFEEDRKTKLADRVEKLKGVTFHHKLGTLHQKTGRLTELVVKLADMLGGHDLRNTCRRAAQLSKADLLTGMVGEFPTLQGIIGGEYARYDGESEEVSRAIAEQYLPRSMDDALPQTLAGKILSLADRLDTLAAFFHVGIVPTGSEDPLGLRRHATAVVRIIIEGNLRLNLGKAADNAWNIAADDLKLSAPQPSTILLNFIAERLRYYCRTVHGLREDVIEALAKRSDKWMYDLVDVVSRMKALQSITARPEFDPLMVGFKRAHRLVEKEQWTGEEIHTALFQHPTEAELHKVVNEARQLVQVSIKGGDYAKAMDALVRMKPAIDGFFEGVMVNADDPALRANRLSLLYAIDQLFLSFADFSQIVVQGT